jgi:short-subunit dehydrogenase
MSKLNGKVAVITGGNSGIGLATAKLLAKEGAKVVITGRRQSDLDAAVKEIGVNATAVQGDVTKIDDLDRLYAEVKQKFGHIDILYANAGVADMAPLGAITEEHFDKVMGINVKGVIFTVQKALPLLKDGGSIVLTASVVDMKGMDGFTVYSATKAALRSFARTWTSELKSRKIRVNVVSPGPIETPIFGKMGLSETQISEFGSAVAGMIPLARFGKADEIAKAVLFLSSDDSSYVAGAELYVDGGMGAV